MVKTIKNKKSAVESIKKEEVIKTVSELGDKPTIATHIAKLQVEISHKLAALQADLTEQLSKLDKVEQLIKYKQQELKDLYSLETTANAANELEDKISTTKEQWARDLAERERTWAEEHTASEKECRREEEEYNYATEQRHRKKEDEFNERLAKLAKGFEDGMAVKTKQLNERQEAIQASEQELTALRARVANIQTEIAKEVNAKAAEVTEQRNKLHSYEFGALRNQMETNNKLADQRVSSAQAETAKAMHQLEVANKTIAELRSDIKEISTEAFRSVSGQAALSAVKDMQRTDQPATKSGR